jgi:3-hydroxybutyrate dehydrogenase
MKLENTIAIVRGAASGIGKPMACEYAAEDARVAIADLKLEAAEAAADGRAAMGATTMAVAMDVATEDEMKKVSGPSSRNGAGST